MSVWLLASLEMLHEPVVTLINVLHYNVKIGRILQQFIDTYYIFLVQILIYLYFLQNLVFPVISCREFLLRYNLDRALLISYLFALCEHSFPKSISLDLVMHLVIVLQSPDLS